MFCSHCGAQLSPGTRFCSNCGQVVAASPATTPAPAPAPSSQSGTSSHTATPPIPAQSTQPMQVPPPKSTTTQIHVKPEFFVAAGTSVGIGFAAMIVMTVISTLIITTSYHDYLSQFDYAIQNIDIPNFFISAPNFMHYAALILTLGLGGQYSIEASSNTYISALGTSSGQVSAQLTTPIALIGLCLVLGCAFGAYWMAHKQTLKFRSEGVVSSLLVGLVSAILTLIITAIFQYNISLVAQGEQVSLHMSGATFRTAAVAFILATVGAIIGYYLAEVSRNSSNIFTAAWQWAHQARGPMRMIVESVAIFTAVFAVLGLILFIVIAANIKNFSIFPFIIMLWPLASALALIVPSWGAFSLQMHMTNDPWNSSLNQFNANLSIFNLGNIPQLNVTWAAWILFVIVIVCTLYLALRAAARNAYDPAYASWSYSWQAPAFWLVFWLIVPVLFIHCSVGATISNGNSGQFSAMPALWFACVAAVWSFLAELCARVLGPTVISSVPALWPVLVGGTVRPGLVRTARINSTQASAPQSTDHSQSQPPHLPNGMAPAPTYSGVSTPAPAPAAPSSSVPPAPTASGISAPTLPPRSTAAVPPAAGFSVPPSPATTAQSPLTSPHSNSDSATTTTMPMLVAGPPNTGSAKHLTAKQKKTWIITAIVVAALAAIGITYSVLNSTLFSPNAVVKEYLSAIESGDYNRANEMASPQLKSDQAALLTNAASGSAESRISNIQIVNQKPSGNAKTITVSYTLGGKQVTRDLTVARDGNQALIFPKWKISQPLLENVTVQYPSSLDFIVVNTVQVSQKNAIENTGSGYTFAVYPGTYEVTIGKTPYLTQEPLDIVTNGDASGTTQTLQIAATEELQDALQSKIDEYVDECAKSTSQEPQGCPFSANLYWTAKTRNFSWTISKYPQLSDIAIDTGSFSTTDGTAKYTYEYNSSDSWRPESSSTYINTLHGTFDIDGDSLDVSVSSSSGY